MPSARKDNMVNPRIDLYPNPANNVFNIRYFANVQSDVTIKLYNINGQELALIAEQNSLQGYNFVEFNVSGYPSGVYYVSLETANGFSTQKLIIQ